MSRRGKGLYFAVARSGGRTQLHRIIDLVEAGKSPDEIAEWCRKIIDRSYRPRRFHGIPDRKEKQT